MDTKYYNSKEELLKTAKECINVPFKDIQNKGQLSNIKNKGSIGNMIQECWFGRVPNSLPEPDFAEIGVELKVTPFSFILFVSHTSPISPMLRPILLRYETCSGIS